MSKIRNLQKQTNIWSASAFGKDGKRGVSLAIHLKKEVKDELIPALKEFVTDTSYLDDESRIDIGEYLDMRSRIINEYVDCLLLLLDSASQFDININDIVRVGFNKLEINKGRKWAAPDKDGVIFHI